MKLWCWWWSCTFFWTCFPVQSSKEDSCFQNLMRVPWLFHSSSFITLKQWWNCRNIGSESFLLVCVHLIHANKLQIQKFLAYKFIRRKLYISYFCIGSLICTILQHASLTLIQFIVYWVWNKTRTKLAFTVTFSLQGPIGYPKYLWRPSNILKGHSLQAWNHWRLYT